MSAASSRVHEYPPEKLQQLLDDARWLLRAYELGFDPHLLAGAAADMTTCGPEKEIDPLPVDHLIAVSCTSYCNRYCVTRCKLSEEPSEGDPDS